MRVAILISLILLSGVDPSDRRSDRVAIAAIARGFSAAYIASDTTALGHFYTYSAVILPPGKIIRGRESIQAYFFNSSGQERIRHQKLTEEISFNGDTAIDIGTWLTESVGQNGEPAIYSGKYLVIWQKQPDGAWKIVYDMWHRGVKQE